MIYAVSDIHGCFYTFLELLKKVNFDENKDTLYILGDIVDRGPYIWELYEWVKERINKSVFMIQGNHEDMLISDISKMAEDKKRVRELLRSENTDARQETYKKFYRDQKKYGYYLNFDSYHTIKYLMIKQRKTIQDMIDMSTFFSSLPYYYEVSVNNKNIRLVHAYCRKDLNATRVDEFIWDRTFAETDSFCMGETVVYGHTPTQIYQNNGDIQIDINEQLDAVKINIDCGCVFQNKLCMLRLDDMKYFYEDCIDV